MPATADQVAGAAGYVDGFGFGRLPLVALATFSVWESVDAMRAFAWDPGAHADVIADVRAEAWFTEEFFARLAVIRGPDSAAGGR